MTSLSKIELTHDHGLRLVELVESATMSIQVESMQLSDEPVRSALLARKAAGVDVRVILAAPSWVGVNASIGADLVKHGIPARYLSAPAAAATSFIAP